MRTTGEETTSSRVRRTAACAAGYAIEEQLAAGRHHRNRNDKEEEEDNGAKGGEKKKELVTITTTTKAKRDEEDTTATTKKKGDSTSSSTTTTTRPCRSAATAAGLAIVEQLHAGGRSRTTNTKDHDDDKNNKSGIRNKVSSSTTLIQQVQEQAIAIAVEKAKASKKKKTTKLLLPVPVVLPPSESDGKLPFAWHLHHIITAVSKTRPDIITWVNNGQYFYVNPSHNDNDGDDEIGAIMQRYFDLDRNAWYRTQNRLCIYGFRMIKNGPYAGAHEHPCFHENLTTMEQFDAVTLKNAKELRENNKKQQKKKKNYEPPPANVATATTAVVRRRTTATSMAAAAAADVEAHYHHQQQQQQQQQDNNNDISPVPVVLKNGGNNNSTSTSRNNNKKGKKKVVEVSRHRHRHRSRANNHNNTKTVITPMMQHEDDEGNNNNKKPSSSLSSASGLTTTKKRQQQQHGSSSNGNRWKKRKTLSPTESATDDEHNNDNDNKPFAWRLQRMVSEVAATRPDLVNWVLNGSAFVVNKGDELDTTVHKYFPQCRRFSELRVKMGSQGWQLIKEGEHKGTAYEHPLFHRYTGLEQLKKVSYKTAKSERESATPTPSMMVPAATAARSSTATNKKPSPTASSDASSSSTRRTGISSSSSSSSSGGAVQGRCGPGHPPKNTKSSNKAPPLSGASLTRSTSISSTTSSGGAVQGRRGPGCPPCSAGNSKPLAVVTTKSSKKDGPFCFKPVWAMLNQTSVTCPELLRWTEDGSGLVVRAQSNDKELDKVIKKYFPGYQNFETLRSKMASSGFRVVKAGKNKGAFRHPRFHRDMETSSEQPIIVNTREAKQPPEKNVAAQTKSNSKEEAVNRQFKKKRGPLLPREDAGNKKKKKKARTDTKPPQQRRYPVRTSRAKPVTTTQGRTTWKVVEPKPLKMSRSIGGKYGYETFSVSPLDAEPTTETTEISTKTGETQAATVDACDLFSPLGRATAEENPSSPAADEIQFINAFASSFFNKLQTPAADKKSSSGADENHDELRLFSGGSSVFTPHEKSQSLLLSCSSIELNDTFLMDTTAATSVKAKQNLRKEFDTSGSCSSKSSSDSSYATAAEEMSIGEVEAV